MTADGIAYIRNPNWMTLELERMDEEPDEPICPACNGEKIDDDGLPCQTCEGAGHVSRATLRDLERGDAADYYYESYGDR